MKKLYIIVGVFCLAFCTITYSFVNIYLSDSNDKYNKEMEVLEEKILMEEEKNVQDSMIDSSKSRKNRIKPKEENSLFESILEN